MLHFYSTRLVNLVQDLALASSPAFQFLRFSHVLRAQSMFCDLRHFQTKLEYTFAEFSAFKAAWLSWEYPGLPLYAFLSNKRMALDTSWFPTKFRQNYWWSMGKWIGKLHNIVLESGKSAVISAHAFMRTFLPKFCGTVSW